MLKTMNLVLDLNHRQAFEEAVAEFLAVHSVYSSLLVQVFSGLLDKPVIESHLHFLNRLLPDDAVVIGCTTGGEIVSGKMLDGQVVVSMTAFQETALKVTVGSAADVSGQALGRNLAEAVTQQDAKAVILLMDGLKVNGEDVMMGFAENAIGDPVLSGGMAADNFAFQQTWLFYGEAVFDQSVIAVALNSQTLKATKGFNLSWSSIGPKMKVTRSEGARVYELDHQPILDVYRQFLGEEFMAKIPSISVDFPLVIQNYSTPIARGMIDVLEDGSVVYAGNLFEGEEVRFGVANANHLATSTDTMVSNLVTSDAQTCFVYSCAGRKSYWKNQLEVELGALEKLAPSAGFFTYGEIFQLDEASGQRGCTTLLNITTTVLCLAEPSSDLEQYAPIKIEKPIEASEDQIFLNALLHLVSETSHQLDDQLEERSRGNQILSQFKAAINDSFIVSRADPFGTITEVNDKFVEISGYEREELIGHNHNLVRDPDTPIRLFTEMWQTIRAKQTWRGTIKNQRKNGGFYIVKTTIIPILDLEGEIVEYLSLREDVTEFVEQQSRLEREQSIIRTLFDNQKSLVIMSNVNLGRMEMVNQAFLDFIGIGSLQEFLESYDCICDLFVAEEGFLQKQMEELSWSEYVLAHPELEHRAKVIGRDDKVHIFAASVSKIAQQADRIIANFVDITELEQERIRAVRAEKAQANFLASMSHELRTPINGILGFANLLEDTSLNKEQSRFVEVLIHSSERLLSVVNDILDFSKIEQGELLITPEPENIFVDLDKSMSSFMPVANNKGVYLEVDLSPNLPECLCYDSLRINQILTNLVSNAIKFTPAGGKVKIQVEKHRQTEQQASILFSVQDTGIGIPQDKQAQVFESFKQVSGQTAKQFGGTGLGLSIANKLVQQMGGDCIHLDSDEGKGASFSFCLPLDTCQPKQSLSEAFSKLKVGLATDGSVPSRFVESICDYLDAFKIPFEVNAKKVCQSSCSTGSCVFDLVLVLSEDAFASIENTFDKQTWYVFFYQPSHSLVNYPNVVVLEQFDQNHSRLYNLLLEFVMSNKRTNKFAVEGIFGGKLLLAEDHLVNQKLMDAVLRKLGVAYDLAENGLEALKLYEANHYDLILLDINMPEMGGEEALQQIREFEQSEERAVTPVYALTANVLPEDVTHFESIGFNGHLGKPLNVERLKEVLAMYAP